MFRKLRNSGLGQIFLGGIVVAIIMAFIFTGAQPGAASVTEECSVEVGKSCVSPKEFQAALRLVTSVGVSDKAVSQLRLRTKVGRGLAEREVLINEATRMGFATAESSIDDELFEGRARVSLPADGAERLALNLAMCIDGPSGCEPGTVGLRALSVKQNGVFDYALYQRTVRVVTGRSTAQFKEMQMREYTAERMRNLIRSQVRVSADEAFLAYSRARSKATGRTVSVETEWFQKYLISPTPEEVKAFSESHKEALDAAVKSASDKWTEGCAVVSEIRLDSADPGSEESESAKKKADKLRASLSAGAKFDAVARAESQADSAVLGGRLGCLDMSYGAGAAVLVESAKALKKPGELSQAVETIRGHHLLQLVDLVTKDNKDALLRDFIAYKLTSEDKAKQAASAFAQAIIDAASKGQSLEDAVSAEINRALASTPFSAEDSAPRKAEGRPTSDITKSVSIEQNPVPDSVASENPAMTLFELVKDDDVAKKPIQTQKGFVVLQLKSKEMVTEESFKDDKPRIMATLQKRKAEQALASHVEQLIRTAGGAKFDENLIPKDEGEESPVDKKASGS